MTCTNVPNDRPGRALRGVLYARYSTEEQDASSIDDQFLFCRTHLSHIGLHGTLDEVSDAEMSGERRHRPGIDEIREGILARRWNFLATEDSGRAFRHPTYCLELVELAVDNGIRVICINDDVDTNEQDWPERLYEAQSHHSRANTFTRRRLSRKIAGLWKMGAAVTALRPGMRRRPSRPSMHSDSGDDDSTTGSLAICRFGLILLLLSLFPLRVLALLLDRLVLCVGLLSFPSTLF